jgi:hypothetical protein
MREGGREGKIERKREKEKEREGEGERGSEDWREGQGGVRQREGGKERKTDRD